MRRLCAIFIVILLQSSLTLFAQLLNGNFEEGYGSSPASWQTDSYTASGVVFDWEENSGLNGTRCISIQNTLENDSRWVQSLSLIPNTLYKLEGWIKGENITNHQSDYVYGNISLLNSWDYESSPKGSFDWTRIALCFRTDNTGRVTIALRLGYYGNVVTGRIWFDDFSLTETSDYCGLTLNEGEYIRTYLKDEDLQVISPENMSRWLLHLDSCYVKYHELVGFVPFGGEKIDIVSKDTYPGGWAIAGNPVLWFQQYIRNELSLVNDQDHWSFGIMHEISHNFDDPSWNFYGEHFANFKLYYAAEQLNAKIVYEGIPYLGGQIGEVLNKDYLDRLQIYNETGSFERFRDGLTWRFINISDSIGWEPFRKTFRALKPLGSPPDNVSGYKRFMDSLSWFSGQDVRAFLPKQDRDLFVKSLSNVGERIPFSPDSLSVYSRDCGEIKLSFKYPASTDGVYIQRRTEHTWFRRHGVCWPPFPVISGKAIWTDTVDVKDSVYYYRMVAVNDQTGLSALTPEIQSNPLPLSHTPEIIQDSITWCVVPEMNLQLKRDTLDSGNVIFSFLVRDSANQQYPDTLLGIVKEKNFNNMLNVELFVEDFVSSSSTYAKLFFNLNPGLFNMRIDSVSINGIAESDVITLSIEQGGGLSLRVKNLGLLQKNPEGFVVRPMEDFSGRLKLIIKSEPTCSFEPASDTFRISLVQEWNFPGPVVGDLTVCEGEPLKYYYPDLHEGQHVCWDVSGFSTDDYSEDNDTLIFQLSDGFYGKYPLFASITANCGNENFRDSAEIRVIENPEFPPGDSMPCWLCEGDSVHLFRKVSEGTMISWLLPKGDTLCVNDTLLPPVSTSIMIPCYLSNDFGCRSEKDSMCFELIKVHAGFQSDTTEICQGESICFENMSEQADSFIWYVESLNPTGLENPVCSFPEPGDYSVALLAIDRKSLCSDSIMKKNYISVMGNTSIFFLPNQDLNIYPVPATEKIFMIPVNEGESIRKVEIYNLSGRLFIQREADNLQELDLRSLDPGVYILKATLNNHKLVITEIMKI